MPTFFNFFHFTPCTKPEKPLFYERCGGFALAQKQGKNKHGKEGT